MIILLVLINLSNIGIIIFSAIAIIKLIREDRYIECIPLVFAIVLCVLVLIIPFFIK